MICASRRLTLESAGRGKTPLLWWPSASGGSVSEEGSLPSLAVCRDRIRHRHPRRRVPLSHRLTLRLLGRQPDRRPQEEASRCCRCRRPPDRHPGQPLRAPAFHQRLVCANRNRRWGLRRKWGDFGAIDRTSYRHRIFWRGHGGKRSAVADQPVRSDWGRYRNAAATGALQGISLSASLSSASGAASCSGALPTILITPCSGSASTAVPASRASGSVFCRVETPRAVVRIASTSCVVRVP